MLSNRNLFPKQKQNKSTCNYCSASQCHDTLENLCINFNLLFNNKNDETSISSFGTADCDTCCSRRWKNDITNSTGKEYVSLTLLAGYAQIINKPNHVVKNSMPCIELIVFNN